MQASFFPSVGVSESIAGSLEACEALALRLAAEPVLLTELRQRLARNRSTLPLFDIARFTRGLESAYTQMWETWKAGRRPTAFSV